MPYRRNQPIIAPQMWRNIILQAVYQIVVLTLILFKGPQFFGIESSIGALKYSPESAVHFTIFFQAFVMMQVFNEFNSRKLDKTEYNIFSGLFNNWLFWFIIVTTFSIQFALVQLGGEYVGVTALTMRQHLICLSIGFCSLLLGVVIKLIPDAVYNCIPLLRDDPVDLRKLPLSK